MNDRLQIAAMAMQGYNALGHSDMGREDKIAESLADVDTLLAKAEDEGVPVSHDDNPGAYDGSKYVYCGQQYSSLVARLHAELADFRAEIARLKSELERVTAPLEDEECDDIALDMRVSNHENIRKWDRAIAAVKMGRKSNV